MMISLIETDGGKLAVEVEGDGPLVICSPAMGDTRDAFGPLAAYLVGRGYRVARIDLRGHGDSTARFNRYGDEAIAEDFLTVIEALGGGPAVLPPGLLTNQPACKPGSVWRKADALRVTAIPLERRLPGASSNLPGRQDSDTYLERAASRRCAPRRPYSVLLPVGFAMPPALPPARCALTAPFHPCRGGRCTRQRAAAVCFLWHCPWGRPRRTLSGTICPWSPDFPPRRPFGRCRSGRPAD